MSNSKEYNRKYYLEHKEERKEKHNRSSREYYSKHKNEIRNRRRKTPRIRKTLEDRRNYIKEYTRIARVEALTYYGGGKLACVKCGFSDIRALSIDHKNNSGAMHRKKIGRTSICRWLRSNHYPEGYQTLCMNCQWIKR